MSQEREAYQRAVGGALLALIVSIVTAGVFSILGAYTDPKVFFPAVGMIAAGIPALFILILVYQQHRLERQEALDAQLLRNKTNQDAQLFQAGDQAFVEAKKRLDGLHRWGLTTGAFIAAALYIAGAVYFWQTRPNFGTQHAEEIHQLSLVAVPLALSVGAAFFNFLAARYLAGLSARPEWQLLRAAASLLMGNALASGALALALALAHFEWFGVLHALPLIFPLVLGALGLETLVSLLLGFYRPRKAGEIPRPAFDSRLLGMITSSTGFTGAFQDAVNYQFGFEITRSWFWKLMGQSVLPFGMFAAGALIFLSCFVWVGPHQQALVTRFGKWVDPDRPLEAGLSFKLPWPIESAELFDVSRVHELTVGSHESVKENTAILWSNLHASAENLLIVAPQADQTEGIAPTEKEAGAGRTPSVSLMGSETIVQYRIKSLKDYVTQLAQPERRFRDIAEKEMARFLLSQDIDHWIGKGHPDAGPKLKERIQKAADDEHLGLEVTFVGVAGVHPPQEVADAFHETIAARQEKEESIEKARKEAIEKLAKAGGAYFLAERVAGKLDKLDQLKTQNTDAKEITALETEIERELQNAGGEGAQLIAEQRAYRWKRENEVRGEAERFVQELKAHEISPKTYRMWKYLETVQTMAPSRKYMILGNRKNLTLRWDFKDLDSDLNAVDLMGK